MERKSDEERTAPNAPPPLAPKKEGRQAKELLVEEILPTFGREMREHACAHALDGRSISRLKCDVARKRDEASKCGELELHEGRIVRFQGQKRVNGGRMERGVGKNGEHEGKKGLNEGGKGEHHGGVESNRGENGGHEAKKGSNRLRKGKHQGSAVQPSVEIGPHGGENRRHKRWLGDHKSGFVLLLPENEAHQGEKGLKMRWKGEDETRLMRRNIVEDEHERFFMETNSHKERHKASLMRQ